MLTHKVKTTTPLKVDITDQRLSSLERKLSQLSALELKMAQSYTVSDVHAYDFPEWVDYAQSMTDPDAVRNALYYGFQPLYDALLSNKVNLDGTRTSAIDACNTLMRTGVEYLTTYYTGEPNIDLFKVAVEKVAPVFEQLERVEYYKKSRNLDSNRIYPTDVHHFLIRFLRSVIVGKTVFPDYIIGCACGSSEMAMSLAGLLEVDIGFIRRSHRRGDNEPRVVIEHEPLLKSNSKGKHVLCMEDYICSGNSLKKVMTRVEGYKPACVYGTSLRNSHESNVVHELVNEHGFHLFCQRPL